MRNALDNAADVARDRADRIRDAARNSMRDIGNAAGVPAKSVNAQAFDFVGHARSPQAAGVEMRSSIATYSLTTVFHERSASRS